ncbi:DUF4416 family protein [Hydrogenivirga sp. 128-5-R1-1]|uniref:DUF4416 family protein n=1 Tax=Hydrogenivirga sp. 128-5-R1-1 TaxID=392423 RepID=UPI00015EFFFC|nr:DUF4416 family protein [Hydrogenivirga sp. 128-5-R1-1]EDP73855.1 hypothetical protein HG1285_07657 [Hydrogenivirga sp. 128-5-R1-1]
MKSLLLFALMWKDKENLEKVENHLKKFYGQFLIETAPFELPYSKYYFEEMGYPLFKKFVAVNYLTTHLNLANIKKHCMFIEDKYRNNRNRTVNIDPILVDEEKVLVATKKYRGNRIQIDKDIFVEIELWYHDKEFKSFLWTYLDYKENTEFFKKARKLLKKLKKEGKTS